MRLQIVVGVVLSRAVDTDPNSGARGLVVKMFVRPLGSPDRHPSIFTGHTGGSSRQVSRDGQGKKEIKGWLCLGWFIASHTGAMIGVHKIVASRRARGL